MDPVTGDGVDGLTGDVTRAAELSSFLGMGRDLLTIQVSNLAVARDKFAAHNSSFAVRHDVVLSLSDVGVPRDITLALSSAFQVAHDSYTALCLALGLAQDASATLASAFGVAHDALSSALNLPYDPSATLVSAFGADHHATAAISSALGLIHISSDVTGSGVETPDGLTGDAIDVASLDATHLTSLDAAEVASFLATSRDLAASNSSHFRVYRDEMAILTPEFAKTRDVFPALSDLGVSHDATAALVSALDLFHDAVAGLVSALDVSHNAAAALSSAFGEAHAAFVSAACAWLSDLVSALDVACEAIVGPHRESHNATAALGAAHDLTHHSTGGLPSPVSESAKSDPCEAMMRKFDLVPGARTPDTVARERGDSGINPEEVTPALPDLGPMSGDQLAPEG